MKSFILIFLAFFYSFSTLSNDHIKKLKSEGYSIIFIEEESVDEIIDEIHELDANKRYTRNWLKEDFLSWNKHITNDQIVNQYIYIKSPRNPYIPDMKIPSLLTSK